MIKHISVTWAKPTAWYQLTRFMLNEDIKVNGVELKKGFITDGSSIPFGLRSIFNPVGKSFPAACVHDYMCKYEYDRKAADELFYENLLECGVNRYRARCMWVAVSAYGLLSGKY